MRLIDADEIWKPIKDYEGLYEVSNTGKVRSLSRYKNGNFNSKVFIDGKELKHTINNRGYCIVQLCKDGKCRNFSIHRLVALTFIDNPNNLPQVNHKDEDKANNCVDNLEWMSSKRNLNYGTRNQRMAITKGKSVCAYDDLGNFIMSFCSISTAEKITGIKNISRCITGNTKYAGGFIWKYDDKIDKVVKELKNQSFIDNQLNRVVDLDETIKIVK